MSASSPEKDETRSEDSPRSDEEDGEVNEDDSSPPKTNADPKNRDDRVTTPNDPPLPTGEEPPPLPAEAPPDKPVDDGWEPVWDDTAQAFYFYNRLTNATQWENPRVPDAQKQQGPPGVENYDRLASAQSAPARKVGGYDPAIHGDFDPSADYAKAYEIAGSSDDTAGAAPGTNPADMYAASGTFNRFTGKWQRADLNPENFSDEQKSRRQMNAFFDVDAAANSHNGKSLRAERQNQKLSKAELKAFKEKRREKKEEKRRAWLRD